MTEVTESSIFCVISNPSKSGIRPDSGPQVVEAKERATTLLLTVGMIVKKTATEREHFPRSNYSLLQVHDKCGTPPFTYGQKNYMVKRSFSWSKKER